MGRPRGVVQVLAASIALMSLPPAMAAVILAQNSQVLGQYAQSAGGTQAQLVMQADGSTRLAWTGSLTIDHYRSSASGGALLTPVTGGNFTRVLTQGDVRGQSAAGDISYFQLAHSFADDPAVQSRHSLIQQLQGGRVGPGYQFIGGDIAPQFSTLGTNAGLRGVFGSRQVGATTFSATAGLIGESWESISGSAPRFQPLRHAYAGKIDHAFSPAWTGFFTAQGYADDPGSADANVPGLLPAASGQATTLGLGFLQGPFAVNAELGMSRWDDGVDPRSHVSSAGVIDATWQASEVLSVRAGHHDLGRHFTSLSAMVIPGIRESYAGAGWAASSWLTLDADLRRSRNGWASTGIAERSEMATVSANALVPQWPGASFNAQASQSRGENPGGSRNDTGTLSAGPRYAAATWQTGLTFSRSTIVNDDYATLNGRIDGVTWDAGFTLGDATALSSSSNFAFGVQRHRFDAGVETRGYTASAGASLQHPRWGTLAASGSYSFTEQPTGHDLDTWGVQLEASRTILGKGLLKAYLRSNRSIDQGGVLDYRDQAVGAQLVLSF